ncbi:hypothetical protein EXIGLDRAFT_834869 [Exidia glandulosa HHB12029]|uniref:Uncharacterized protein n=1 Tax=Exidia glandulosa HHB12029 TaxID=1314781 RepID=A0A165JD05_EXIGL|nr:hypothetical protein EXIGLDRAFT_834869 [Exidia glandulosa HHB12029]
MYAPRALVLVVVALVGAAAAAPSFAGYESKLVERKTCSHPTFGTYTCPGACCTADDGTPGCLGQGLVCYSLL